MPGCRSTTASYTHTLSIADIQKALSFGGYLKLIEQYKLAVKSKFAQIKSLQPNAETSQQTAIIQRTFRPLCLDQDPLTLTR